MFTFDTDTGTFVSERYARAELGSDLHRRTLLMISAFNRSSHYAHSGTPVVFMLDPSDEAHLQYLAGHNAQFTPRVIMGSILHAIPPLSLYQC